MLRNQQRNKQILKHVLPVIQQRWIQHQNSVLCNKNTNVSRQGKIMAKLFNHRVSGSKKRWFPSATETMQSASPNMFGKSAKRDGKNVTRRMAVLNKLFMEHVTDLLATGEMSDIVLGKGLQVTQVKTSQDFAYVNVFWVPSGEIENDSLLEQELQRCSGLLRHELSQLGVMGTIPRIKFVRDKQFSNMNQIEALVKNMDFGNDEDAETREEFHFRNTHQTEALKQEFYGYKRNDISAIEQQDVLDVNIPEMRHDVLGLDHKSIMIKILAKMRKSKQAWDEHLKNSSSESNNLKSIDNSSSIPSTSYKQFARSNEKLAKAAANSEKFEDFLAKRKEKRNTPERKKFRASDHNIHEENRNYQPDNHELSVFTRQLYEADDYLLDESENLKHK